MWLLRIISVHQFRYLAAARFEGKSIASRRFLIFLKTGCQVEWFETKPAVVVTQEVTDHLAERIVKSFFDVGIYEVDLGLWHEQVVL